MTDGYLYILWNPIYEWYGPNMYKLGKTENLTQRMSGYCTSYLEQSIYKHTSPYLDDIDLAEKILFASLNKYRMRNKREFFECDLDIIKNRMEMVTCIMSEGIETNLKSRSLEFVCPYCQYNCATKGDIKRHFKGRMCKGIKNRKTQIDIDRNLIKAKKIETITEPIQIETIKKPTQIENLKEAKKIEISNDTKEKSSEFICPNCQYNFTKKSNLKRHLNGQMCKSIKNRKTLAKIDETLTKFTQIETLSKPNQIEAIISVNGKSSELICPYCKYEFTLKSNLIRHIKSQTCRSNNTLEAKVSRLENQLIELMQKQDKEFAKLKEQQLDGSKEIADLKNKPLNVNQILQVEC